MSRRKAPQTRRTVSLNASTYVSLRMAAKEVGRPATRIVEEAVRAWLAMGGHRLVGRDEALAELARKDEGEPADLPHAEDFLPPPDAAPFTAGDSLEPPPKATCDVSWTDSEHVSGVALL